MSAIETEKKEYTYEEACKVLGVSMATLNRAIAKEVFGVNPIYHTRGKVNISFPGHMPSQTRRVAHSPNSNGVVLYYTHPQ